jgi:hypothetical protein
MGFKKRLMGDKLTMTNHLNHGICPLAWVSSAFLSFRVRYNA